MQYKAWIPNVSGNLSFSNIKGTKIPNRAKAPLTFNHIGNEKIGLIYSLQERDLSDSPLPNKEGDFYYLLKAKIENRWEENEVLDGYVITYPKTQVTAFDKTLIRTFSSEDFHFTEAEELIKSWSKNSSFVKVNFQLYRDGFIDITLEDHESNLDNDARYSIVFESYSFLKDLIHAHKFHRFDDDAIVVPYPERDNPDCIWVVKTLRNLHKSVVFSYRNASHQQDIINALGKLTYLNGFQVVAKKRYGESIRDDFWIDTENLQISLDLKLKDQEAIENSKSNLVQTALNIILSVFALIIAMTQLLQVPCIDGLTFSENCKSLSGEKFIFTLDHQSLGYVQLILKYWSNLTLGMPLVIVVILTILNYWRIDRWINNNIGHNWWGGYIRSVLAFAVSERYGKAMAFLWILIFAIFMIVFLFLGLGILHLSSS